MRNKITSFGALLLEVAIAFGIIHWLWGDNLLLFVFQASVVALLARIMFLMETIASRAP